MRKIEKHAIAVNSTGGLRSVPNPKKTAKALQAMGTKGDTVLAHISPREATLLDMLSDGKLDGGGLNPSTGLRSFDRGDSENDGSNTSNAGENTGGMSGAPGSGVAGPEGPGTGRGDGPGQDGLGSDYSGPFGGRGFDPENNPEMGGGRARGRGLASTAALGAKGEPQTNVNQASSIMAGLDPTWGDKAKDTIGWGAPGGFAQSRAANAIVSTIGGLIGGPGLAGLASVVHDVGVRGRSIGNTVPGAVGGLIGGLPGRIAGQEIADAVRGYETFDKPMTEHDRGRRSAELDNAATGTPGAPGTPGANPGSSDGAGAGTDYVMAPPPAAAPPTATAAAPTDGWDEAGFLTRNPEVAKAVESGTWTSGKSFNTAYKAQAGANYDTAKALGLVSPYRDDMLAAAPGVAVPFRGV
jgi:hypothetical protein